MVGRNSPDAQAASRSSRAASIRPSSSGSSSPARARTRAWAREPAMSYGASRQSNWTLTDSRASASAGPPANRPPQSRVGADEGDEDEVATRPSFHTTINTDLKPPEQTSRH